MPDANGNVKGISVPARAWERIFGQRGDMVRNNRLVVHANRELYRGANTMTRVRGKGKAPRLGEAWEV